MAGVRHDPLSEFLVPFCNYLPPPGCPRCVFPCLFLLHRGSNQKFDYYPNSGKIFSRADSDFTPCLDVNSDGYLVTWECHDGQNQKFYIDAVGRLRPRHRPLACLDGYTVKKSDRVYLSGDNGCHTGYQQKWYCNDAVCGISE